MNLFEKLLENGHRIPTVHLTVRPNSKRKGSEQPKKDITTLITDRLISLTLTDSRGFEADQLDIELDDTDGRLEMPARNAVLALGLGWKDEALTYKGEYTVDEVEHSGVPDKITIRARSADLRGTLMNRHERSFSNTTIGKIVQQIAEENQLTAMVGEEFRDFAIKHIDQTNESSINLLSRLGADHDAIATVKNGRLLFIKAGNSTTASGKPLPPIQIHRQSGDSHRFSIAEGDNFKAVKAYWHDTNTGKRGEVVFDENTEVKKVVKPTMRKVTKVKRGKAGEPMRDSKGRVKKDKNGNIKTYKKGKVIKGKDGQSIKETVFVKGKGRKVNEVVHHKPVESDSENIKTLRHTYATQQSALNACKRNFEKLQRGLATFSLSLAEGNAELMPEMTVSVAGFKAQIDSNDWLITQVTHSLNADSGFTSQVEMELRAREI